jgi:DNA-nicking Smr family endonuclease
MKFTKKPIIENKKRKNKPFQLAIEDKLLFENAVKDVKPIKHDKIHISQPKASVNKNNTLTTGNHQPETIIYFRDLADIPPVTCEQYIAYKHPSIPDKILRNLRKGQYNVSAVIDMHGMRVDEAEKSLQQFIQRCLSTNIRVALIIHGKGQAGSIPVLKNKMNHWLRQLDEILAFCSATKDQGANGALFILLKSNKTGERGFD